MQSGPTQALPSWMTYSTTTITNSAGDPVSTSVTILMLPLTYYGPSIPLGTDNVWVYGGLSSPAPSGSLPPPSITSTISSPSSSSISSSTSSTLGPTSNSSSSSHLSGNFIGAIVGSILAAILLLLLGLAFLRCTRNRRRRTRSGHDILSPPPVRRSRHSEYSGVVVEEGIPQSNTKEPIWTGWSMVHSRGSRAESSAPPVEGDWALLNDNGSVERVIGQGSPRGSGEETDSFLQRSTKSALPDTMQSGLTARLVTVPSVLTALHLNTQNSTDTTSSDTSGYGAVLDPSISRFSAPPVSQWGHILPPSALLRMNDENPIRGSPPIKEEDEQYSPLKPPRPLDPDNVGPLLSKKSQSSIRSSTSAHYPDTPRSWDETAELMTAQKIRVDEVGHARARQVPSAISEQGSSRLFGSPLSALSRLSWFKRLSGGTESSRGRLSSDANKTPNDGDIEAKGGISGALLVPEGTRPLSGLSARSGHSSNGTVYHDALSVPETPLLAHLPLAVTSGTRSRLGQTHVLSGIDNPSIRIVEPEQPPEYDESANDAASSTVRDVLDSPAPRPASPFASSTATSRTMPPSHLVNSRSWQESLSTLAGSSAGSAGITIDVLEEEPPPAGERWRSLTGGPDHRATFGTPPLYIHSQEATRSEQGSLHSHLSPQSFTSDSVRFASNVHTPESSIGSSSHSRGATGSSGASFSPTRSVSSIGRLRWAEAGEAPLRGSVGQVSVGATGANATRLTAGSPTTSSLLHQRYDSQNSTTASLDRGSNVTTEVIDSVTGVTVQLPRAPAWETSIEHNHNLLQTNIPE